MLYTSLKRIFSFLNNTFLLAFAVPLLGKASHSTPSIIREPTQTL